MGGKIAAVFTTVVFGIMLADIVKNGQGTKQAAEGVASVLKPTYNALLGQTS
jgi:hypothetical protein